MEVRRVGQAAELPLRVERPSFLTYSVISGILHTIHSLRTSTEQNEPVKFVSEKATVL